MSQPGIARKIGYGYMLAIGVATLGATIGLIVGDYYQKQAQTQLAIARKQQSLLTNLEHEILELRSHPQRLVMVFGDSIWFDFERTAFLTRVREAQELVAELNAFIERNPHNLAIGATGSKKLAEEYETNTEAYADWVRTIWQQLNPGSLTQPEIPIAQQSLLASLRQEPAIRLDVKFEQLAEQLHQALETAQKQQDDADIQLQTAEALRLQIILTGLAVAAAIAALLALYTSRAIARPIEAVTQVAQRVSRESDFQLQAPVLSQDEVGVLAIAFNNLIRKVAEYTHALELSRQTLEDRVEERTQELQQALDHVKKAQLQLVQAEKMSSLGQLVAGVAHEINNPVNFIHGNLSHASQYTQDLLELLDLYQCQLPNPPSAIQDKEEDIDLAFLRHDLPKLLQSMKVGAERIREIVQSLRTFSRLDEAAIKEVDIHEGLDSTLMILQNRLKGKSDYPAIKVIREYGVLPLVECYAGQLNQVFMNILSNAIDALEERNIQQSLVEIAAPPRTITIRTQAIDRIQVAVWIKDNGPGMTSEVQQQLFNPFFTTKPVGKGTGMGMSISYQIITERHRGSLECISELGKGTEFVITIPIRSM
ncbi:ATP-binding protein [Leptolyngbya sp. GB1-A1]|uniref:sensor histidine kinase n=1 Tax=Leptolyngbya sp. GB1-A1 TaxID=2933908 RepID=UPI003296E487